MTRRTTQRRRLWLFWLPLAAATLACSLLGGGGPPAGRALTQAAATTTVAAQAATSLAAAPSVAPTTAPSATTPPTELVVSTLTSTAPATGIPTPAKNETATPTPAEGATSTPTAAGGGTVLDPCTFISSGEVESLIGAAVGTPRPLDGGCVFDGAAAGMSGMVLYALPSSQSQYFLQQYVTLLKASGVNVDAAASTKLNAYIQAGDTVALVNDLVALSVGQANYNAQKVDGLGSAALWSWNMVGPTSKHPVQDGVLLVAKPGAVVSLELVVGSSIKETNARPPVEQIVRRILADLPANFTVAGLQVAGSAPALDPCSLASSGDAETLLGTKASDGVSQFGACKFSDAAYASVGVFALPAGVTAAIYLKFNALYLSTDPAASAKVVADADAGDVVAAVRDMAAMGKSGGGRTLESVDGLGDSSVLFIEEREGSIRHCILFVAKPGVLVGLELFLAPGDDAAIKKAEVELMTRILSKLPAKFTVSGVP